MGSGFINGFTEHLELVTTSSCNSSKGLHSLQITALQQTYSSLHLYQVLPTNGYQQCRLLSSLTYVLVSWRLSCASLWPQLAGFCLVNSYRPSVSQSNCYWPLPPVFPGFSLLEIHDQDLYSVLNMYVFQNEASSLTKVGLAFLCRSYIYCSLGSA
jgi:hypothetical protein